jgi:hypothetical protein
MMFEYKCVAGPARIAVKTEADRAKTVMEFENIINSTAREGWEYVGMDEYQTATPTGCLGSGAPDVAVLKLLVFRRPT